MGKKKYQRITYKELLEKNKKVVVDKIIGLRIFGKDAYTYSDFIKEGLNALFECRVTYEETDKVWVDLRYIAPEDKNPTDDKYFLLNYNFYFQYRGWASYPIPFCKRVQDVINIILDQNLAYFYNDYKILNIQKKN